MDVLCSCHLQIMDLSWCGKMAVWKMEEDTDSFGACLWEGQLYYADKERVLWSELTCQPKKKKI